MGEQAPGPVEALAAAVTAASRVVAFTGAGISTDSGIPDFRSPGGIWTRYDPRDFTFERYVESAEVRASAWAMRREFVDAVPEPNPAHRALATLEQRGRLVGVITQNIDGLHQAAGSGERAPVVEIHGSARTVECIGQRPRGGQPEGCGFNAPHEWAMQRVEAGEPDPACPECGGLVKSATVSFGELMPQQPFHQAQRLAELADLFLTVGSSLQVSPAASLPLTARRAGAGLAIVNDEDTPLDDLADHVVRGRAAEVLPLLL